MHKRTERTARKARDTKLDIDRSSPAYRVIYGAFGGLTPFARATGVPTPTAQRWVVEGVIPNTAARPNYLTIMRAAKKAKIALDPAIFVGDL